MHEKTHVQLQVQRAQQNPSTCAKHFSDVKHGYLSQVGTRNQSVLHSHKSQSCNVYHGHRRNPSITTETTEQSIILQWLL